ncbi:hypothetical protein DY000_02011337 [Brassica cretica]|uniref:Uncharacterized protein n=1 Tax=Brassica cretica TaxID=69181 RepID=A0ABQ7D0Z9_BRACR|nr:hypothetical protein DY000_02011337 [Brassica cretica]
MKSPPITRRVLHFHGLGGHKSDHRITSPICMNSPRSISDYRFLGRVIGDAAEF